MLLKLIVKLLDETDYARETGDEFVADPAALNIARWLKVSKDIALGQDVYILADVQSVPKDCLQDGCHKRYYSLPAIRGF